MEKSFNWTTGFTKKIVLVAYLLFNAGAINAQQIDGTWHWNSANNENSFELYLDQNEPNTITGHHCAVFYEGKKIDCVESGSINLTLISPTIYEGTIKSGYSLQSGNIRITFNTAQNTLTFELIQKPTGEFYLPDSITMKR